MIGRLIGAVTTQIIGNLLSPPYGLDLIADRDTDDTGDHEQEVAS